MGNMACDDKEKSVFTSDFSEDGWKQYRSSHTTTLQLPCCGSNAFCKTGTPFFAHESDRCPSSPEADWHIRAQGMLVRAINGMGIKAFSEVPGGRSSNWWKSGVYFEFENKKYMIEVRHSYQHMRRYNKRQARYRELNVNCYWVLRRERFATLADTIAKFRIRNEFGGNVPQDVKICGGLGHLPSLPFVFLEPDDREPIKGLGSFSSKIDVWIQSILDGSFSYKTDGWKIRE